MSLLDLVGFRAPPLNCDPFDAFSGIGWARPPAIDLAQCAAARFMAW